MMLLRRAICGWPTVRIVGLLCLSVTNKVPYSLGWSWWCWICHNMWHDLSPVAFCVHVLFSVWLEGGGGDMVECGLRTMINLAVIIICSIPRCQLAHTLLMRYHDVGVRGMSSVTGGLGIILWCVRYSVAVKWSSCVRWSEACWRWYCALECSCAMASAPYILACAWTPAGRMPSVFGANHGGELSLGSVEYVFIKGIFVTRR